MVGDGSKWCAVVFDFSAVEEGGAEEEDWSSRPEKEDEGRGAVKSLTAWRVGRVRSSPARAPARNGRNNRVGCAHGGSDSNRTCGWLGLVRRGGTAADRVACTRWLNPIN